MKRITVAIVLLCCAMPMLGGCWSRRELNDIAIALAMGIDRTGDGYTVSLQIVNPGEVAAKTGIGKGAIVLTQTEEGDTLADALRRITTKTPRKINLAHLRILVFGEELAKSGVGKTLDFLSRNHEVRTDFAVLVARGETAEKILRVYTVAQEPIPANKIFKSLDTSEKVWAATSVISLDELITDISREGKYPVLSGIGLLGKTEEESRETKENVESMKPRVVLHLENLAMFKKDKLVGWLNENESKGYNYIVGHVKGSVGAFSCPNTGGGKVAVEVIRAKSVIKGSVVEGKPKVNVSLRTENNIADIQCDLDLSKLETVGRLEQTTEEALEGYMRMVVKKAQKAGTDIFGFGDAIRRADQAAWEKLKPDWNEEFAKMEVQYQVDVKIRRLGTITDTIDVE